MNCRKIKNVNRQNQFTLLIGEYVFQKAKRSSFVINVDSYVGFFLRFTIVIIYIHYQRFVVVCTRGDVNRVSYARVQLANGDNTRSYISPHTNRIDGSPPQGETLTRFRQKAVDAEP